MRFSYYIFRFFVAFFYIIPFPVLYVFSNITFFILFHLIGYRKKVVFANIKNSFPELNEKERKKIARKFYHNLCDILLEGIKGFTLSKSQLVKRYKVLNPELLNSYFEKNIHVVSVGSHYANWEWGIMAAPLQVKHKIIAFYTPLTNKFVDSYMHKNRSRHGTLMMSSNDARKALSMTKEQPYTYFFGGDQSPSNIKGAHWMKFLNQDTAVMKGAEFFAKLGDMPVVYFDVQRIKRGYYTVNLFTLCEESKKTENGLITETYMHALEKIILKKPEDFLWSHRRWKHKIN